MKPDYANRYIRAALAGTMLSAILTVTVAHAQSGPANGASKNEGDIVVTALKREQNLQDVPATVSVLSQDTLETQKIVRFEDVAAATPGLSVANQGGGRNILTIRGVTSGSGQFNNSVGIYLDDIPVGSSNANNNSAADTGDFDTFDIAQVEVLQGPQGTLYGTNALGGIIRYVANQPDTSGLYGKMEIGGVHASHGGDGLSLKGMVNIPVSDKTAIRISGFRRIDPGFVNNVGAYTQKDQNRDKFEGGRFALQTSPTDRLTITLTGYYQHVYSRGDNQVDLDPETLEPVFGDYARARTFPESYNSKYALGALTVALDLDWARLTAVTSYSDMRNHQNYDFSPYYAAGYAATYGQTPDTFGILGVTLARTQKVTQELRLASNTSSKLEWQIGGWFNDEHSRFTYKALPYAVPSNTLLSDLPFSGSNNPSTYRDLAAYANATYHVTSAFDLTLGARFNNNKQTFNGEQIISLRYPTGLKKSGTSDENAFTFLVSPSWRITPDAMIYARVAKGYRAGGPNALPDGAPAGVPEIFKSDNLVSYEGGVKLTLLDRLLTVNAAAYHIDWKDIQLSTAVQGLGVAINAAKAYIDGAQANISLKPAKGLTFSGNVNYNNARLDSDTPDIGGLKGDRLPNVPAWALTLAGEYSRNLSDDVTGSVGAIYSYSGARYSDYSDNGRALIPSYSTVNVHAGIDYKNFSLNLVVRNLFDTHGYTNLMPVTVYTSGYVIQPRTVGLYGTIAF